MRLCSASLFPFVRLGDCGDVITGSTPPKGSAKFWNGEVPFVTPAQLNLSQPIEAAKEYVTSEGAARGRLLPKDSVLVCCIGSLGKTGIAGVPLISNQQINAIIFNPDKVDARYGYYAARNLTPLLEHYAPSTTIKIVKKSAFADFQIPLPPLAEQKRIAGILDAADVLRAKRRESLAQLDTLLQSTFLDMFGDPVANPMRWESVVFGDLITSGPQNGIYKPSKDYGSGVRILRIDGFYDGAVRDLASLKRVQVSKKEVDTYGLSKSDIVINRVNSRSHLGKCALVPELDEPVLFESNMMRLCLDAKRMLPRFATEFLQTQYVKNQILKACKDAVNQSSINQGDVQGFQVLVPPLELQQRFAAIVGCIEQQKASHRAHLNELDALFASLQSRAFRGDL